MKKIAAIIMALTAMGTLPGNGIGGNAGFNGPIPPIPSGIFVISPDGPGFEIKSKTAGASTPCSPKAEAKGQYLCESGAEYATMDWTWQNPHISGVFIRLRWNEIHKGPGQFDFTVLDREIEKAVKNGKLYSLAFKAGSKGTPEWIFDPQVTGSGSAVKKLKFRDKGSNKESGCGSPMALGSPTDPNFQKLYFDLWRSVAEHIKTNPAWYRALAYVKPSGANLFTHENRLPKNCDSGCNICNTEVWAKEGNYTPEGLYKFYSEQTGLLAKLFPDKYMSYMLIQDGFPEVASPAIYETYRDLHLSKEDRAKLPKGTTQTEKILRHGKREHGIRFVVQHNGLGPKPQYQPNARPACPNEGLHPARPPFGRVASGCPNRWVLSAGAKGQITAFQTNNRKGVGNPAELEYTFMNARDNSDAVFVEIYEERLWEAETAGPVLKSDATGWTVGQWNEFFRQRGRQSRLLTGP